MEVSPRPLKYEESEQTLVFQSQVPTLNRTYISHPANSGRSFPL